jgi:hypothetical protein
VALDARVETRRPFDDRQDDLRCALALDWDDGVDAALDAFRVQRLES